MAWRGASLRARLVSWFLAILILVGVAASALTLHLTQLALRQSMFDRLTAVAIVEEDQLSKWVDDASGLVVLFSQLPDLQGLATELAADAAGSTDAARAQDEVVDFLERIRTSTDVFEEVMLLSGLGGRVLASTDPARMGEFRIDELFFEVGRQDTYVQNVYSSPVDGRPALTVATPVRGSTGEVVAVLAAHLDLARLDGILSDRSGLGETGETYLVSSLNDFVSSERFGRDEYLRGVRSEGIDRALSGENDTGLYDNYAGVPVIGAYRYIPHREMALLVEMDQAEAFAPVRRLLLALLGVGSVSVLLLVAGVIAVARRVTDPVLGVTQTATRVAGGDFDATAPVTTSDEVGRLAAAFNQMTGRLKGLYADLQDQVSATTDALEALRENQELLQAIIDNSTTLVAVTDPDGRYLLANDRFEALFDLPRGRSRGHTALDVLPAGALELGDVHQEAFRLRRVVQREVEVSIGGEVRSFFAVAFPLWDAGKKAPYGTGLIATDITERRRTNEERRRLEAQVQHAQKLESLGVLAGGIAHDFNNLLAAILGNADLAASSLKNPDEAAAHLDQVLVAAQRAAELTNQMLAYAGQASFKTELLDLNEVVAEMSQLVQVSLPKKVRLTYELSSRPTMVNADAAQIRQVVLNLVTNAADAIGTDLGEVTLATRRLDAGHDYLEYSFPRESLEPGPYVLLTIRDTGCGMDETTLNRIFDPFFTTKASGRGLGLAAVTGIVRGSGGALRVESTEGVGSTFEVVLPATAPATERAASDGPAEPQPAVNATVLLVDDEEMVRAMARTTLKRSGFRVVEAADGVEALARFRERKDEISVVVLDMTMPGMGGAEVLREIRKIVEDVPVLVSSGYDREDTARGLDDLAHTDFLQKPYLPAVLVEMVSGLLESYRATA